MANREPLLDTEWLLGSPDTHGPWWRRFLSQLGIVLLLVAAGVGLWPTLSKSWVQNQLTKQYHDGKSADSRNEAMIALAELLPESLPAVIAGLSNPSRDESHLAFEALDYYVGQLTTLSIEQRRGAFAELIHALEEITPNLDRDTTQLATALVARVAAVQQSDQHPGSKLTLAACKRILEIRHSASLAKTTTFSKLSDSVDFQPPAPVTTLLSDVLPNQLSEPQPSTMEGIVTVDNTATPVRMSLKSNEDVAMKPLPFESTASSDAIENTVPLRQKLLRANRFVPVTGALGVPIQSSSVPKMETTATVSANESVESHLKLPTSTTRVADSTEEIIGMGRQKTEYLLTLLGSVTPRLATAAFNELRTRLSPKDLELAVELAQGTPDQRILAMERLIREPETNPIPWLSWMGSEADRDVRFKAVSLLGSINNEDARLNLRLMHNRERDVEISRHIQSALLASGSVKPHIR